MKTIILAVIALTTFAHAAVIEEGVGMIYGKNHVFSLKAPKGWMLDNESGVNQGAHAVFFPKGGTWANSKVVAYANATSRKDGKPNVEQQVEKILKQFHGNGSPKYAGKKIKTVKNGTGREGEIYHFSGDKWGNFEAVAYFPENKTINYIVMSVREEKAFNDALPAFEDLAKSYLFIGEEMTVKKEGNEESGEKNEKTEKTEKEEKK